MPQVPPEKREERAKLLYRWLVTNVQEGEEGDEPAREPQESEGIDAVHRGAIAGPAPAR